MTTEQWKPETTMCKVSDHTPMSAANVMRDEFGMARAILEYSIRENIAGFTLSGLKIPRIIQTWVVGSPLPEAEDFALEVAIFQEHLGDRIAALSHNRKLLEAIWRFNEVSRKFRELELTIPVAARDILDQLANLVNALFAQDTDGAIAVLQHCHLRRFELADEIVPRLREREEEIA